MNEFCNLETCQKLACFFFDVLVEEKRMDDLRAKSLEKEVAHWNRKKRWDGTEWVGEDGLPWGNPEFASAWNSVHNDHFREAFSSLLDKREEISYNLHEEKVALHIARGLFKHLQETGIIHCG